MTVDSTSIITLRSGSEDVPKVDTIITIFGYGFADS